MVDGILAIISGACLPSEISEILAPKACIHFLYSFWNVNLRGADAFLAPFSPAEKISILSAVQAYFGRATGYWNGEYRKRFAATGLVLSKRVFNKKLTMN